SERTMTTKSPRLVAQRGGLASRQLEGKARVDTVPSLTPAVTAMLGRLQRNVAYVTPAAPIQAHTSTVLELQESAELRRLEVPPAQYKRWPNYTFLIAGERVPYAHEGRETWPYWYAELGDGPPVIIRGWYWMAYRVGVPFKAELTWTPEQGIEKVIRELGAGEWSNPRWSDADLRTAGHAMRLLHYLTGSSPGKS